MTVLTKSPSTKIKGPKNLEVQTENDYNRVTGYKLVKPYLDP